MMQIVECAGSILAMFIALVIVVAGVIIYLDNYIEHRKRKNIRASKKVRDDAFEYWEREMVRTGEKKTYRYVCPICVLTMEQPTRYCPDCGTRLKIR